MQKLANISQFESLMNGSYVQVNNGLNPFQPLYKKAKQVSYKLGRGLAGRLLSGKTPGGVGNQKNYDAVKELEQRFFAEHKKFNKRDTPLAVTMFHNGFELFAKYCYGLNIDLADQIRNIQFETDNMLHGYGQARRDENKILWNIEPWDEEELCKKDDGTPNLDYMTGTGLAHELTHLLAKNQIYRSAFKTLPLPMRIRPDCLTMPWEPKDNKTVVSVSGLDRIRKFLSETEYGARVYGKADPNIPEEDGGGEIFLVDRPEGAPTDWYRRVRYDKDVKKRVKDMIMEAGADPGEYDTIFRSNYGYGRNIPLLYALDMWNKIRKINKAARKQQNGETR